MCFCVFQLFFICFLGLNYFIMANCDFWTNSDTFWLIFGTSKTVTKSGPLTPLIYHKATSNKIQENPKPSLTHIVLAHLEFKHFVNLGKDGHRIMPKNRPKKSRKTLIWDQYLSTNMNGCLLIWNEYLLQNKRVLLGNVEIVIISGLFPWVHLLTGYS